MHYEPAWGKGNARRLDLAAQFLDENEELLGILHAQILRAEQNRYNVEVLLSNALLCHQNLSFLLAVGRVDKLLSTASTQATGSHTREAVAAVDRALDLLRTTRDERNQMLAGLTETWEKTWYPRVPEANGRRFLHELDDVKDHFPDRTVDMSYLVLRQLQLPMEEWVTEINAVRNRYASAHGLPAHPYVLNWADLKAAKTVVTTPPTIE